MERKLFIILIYVLIGINLDASAQNILIPQEYSVELEDSAEMGFADAQYKIGKYYYQQYESIKNKYKYQTEKISKEGKPYLEKASSMFMGAARQGNVEAMYGLLH